jgi:hypothetical protein
MNTVGPNRPNRRGKFRKRPRHAIQLQCRRGAMGLGANLATRFIDVSESGVQVVTTIPLKCGDEVEILFEGYGFRGVIRRVGEVRWISPIEDGGCRIGVRFGKYLSFRDVQNLST